MALTREQIALLRTSFDQLKANMEQKSEFFYEELFRRNPDLRPFFRGDIGDQSMRFMSTLSVIVANFDRPDDLAERYADLGEGHRALGIRAADFRTMQEALIATLRHYLGNGFTPEHEAAWTVAFADISTAIITRGGITD